MHRFLFLALILLLLPACMPQTPVVPSTTPQPPTVETPATATFTMTPTLPPSTTPTFTETPSPSITPVIQTPLTPMPGLVLRGHVRLKDGPELAGVKICRNYASYPGTVVATTDTAGYYQTAFASIPGDEMVGVWLLADGYNFDPPVVRWRHYYGFEDSTLDFVATPTAATSVPPGECQ